MTWTSAQYFALGLGLLGVGLLVGCEAKPYDTSTAIYSLGADGKLTNCSVGGKIWFPPRADGLCHLDDAPKEAP